MISSRHTLCLAAFALFLTLAATAGEPMQEPPQTKQEPAAPVPHFDALPGVAVGVLVAHPQAAMKAEGRTGPADAVGFARGTSSYRWVYLRRPDGSKDADTIALPVASGGSKEKEFANVALATSADLRRLRIAAPYALVRVKVNEGLGSPAGADSFLASDIQELDGTPEYPLKTAAVVKRCQGEFAKFVAEQKEPAEAALQALAVKVLGERKPTGPRETAQRVLVTWLPENERLRVELHRQITDGLFRTGRGTTRGPGQVPIKGVPTPGSRYGTLFGVELAVVYEISKTGDVEHTERMPLRTIVKEIPPPR